MSNIKIIPSRLEGRVQVPPSKSLAHRALICAALAGGTSRIDNIDLSDDIRATAMSMLPLGAAFRREGRDYVVTGVGGKRREADLFAAVHCMESGSTLRFLIPVLLAAGLEKVAFTGRGKLGSRPLDPYYDIFRQQGIQWRTGEGNGLDLTVEGQLRPGLYTLPGNVSSQFITGLLLALPMLPGSSEIRLTTGLESAGYLDLTLSVMERFGVSASFDGTGRFVVPGGQQYRPAHYRVEGDYSQGAFFLAAGALGSPVEVADLPDGSLQGDRAVSAVLEQMGAVLTREGDTLSARPGPDGLSAVRIDAADCPDIIPVLAAAAALARGKTHIVNAGRLRIKECDRLHAVARELNRLGGQVEEHPDSLVIHGVGQLEGGCTVWSHRDHRIAMTLAIAATRCRKPVVIRDYECVAKSYPGFFEDYRALGGRVEEAP